MKHVFYRNVIHYLNDFLLVEDPDIEFFNTLAFYLGFSKYVDKREDGTLVKFCGIALDSHTMEACLAQNKLNYVHFEQFNNSSAMALSHIGPWNSY